MKKIIVDMFGADAAPEVLVRGGLQAMQDHPGFGLIFAGDEEIVYRVMAEERVDCESISVIHTTDFVTNHDDPTLMIKNKNTSSMIMAMEAMKKDEDIVGMVTAGSTGCALVGSCFHLGLLKGLKQPALASVFHTVNGSWGCLMDCGANVNARAKDLTDYARLGSVLMEIMLDTENPPVGLMSVGREEGKGNNLTKEAYGLLKDMDIHFFGNMEGSDLLKGEVNVVVCDGFAGNLLLKDTEAAGLTGAGILMRRIEQEKAILEAAKIAGDMDKAEKSAAVIRALEESAMEIRHFFDYNSQGGAIFMGTRKIIVKAHGAANESTIASCVREVWQMECGNFTEKVKERMEN